MSKLVIEHRPITDAVVDLMAAIARPEDVLEFECVRGWSVQREVRYAVELSRFCRAFYCNGKLVALYGDIRVNDEIGCPWLISSHYLPRYARHFLAACRLHVSDMRREYQALLNYTDARYESALRWMRWLGFEQHHAEPYGINGEPFYLFHMRGEQ